MNREVENMPVLGKDFYRIPEKYLKGKREIKKVKATLVHPSETLPKRDKSFEVMSSVKKDGIQKPIVVRPHPRIEGEYEIIDGHNRYYGLFEKPDITRFIKGQEPEILVDIRYGLSDAEVFNLANTLHIRKGRNTYERAKFYVKWIEAKEKELGKKEGALTEVAKELVKEKDTSSYFYQQELASKQSLLSQYVKIYKLFRFLENEYPTFDFNILKSLSINKLYELTKLMNEPRKLIEIIERIMKNPKMSLERIKELAKSEHFTERRRPWSAIARIPPKESQQLKDTLYKLDDRIFESGMKNNEIARRAILSLIKDFIRNPSEWKPEVEKIPRKGYEFRGLLRIRDE